MGDLSANFSRSEFACKCACGFNTVDSELLTILEIVRQHFEAKVKITSGCRCPVHNDAVGGSTSSQHLIGRAADIQVDGIPAPEVYNYIVNMWPDQYGVGSYDTFTHVDSRSVKARW